MSEMAIRDVEARIWSALRIPAFMPIPLPEPDGEAIARAETAFRQRVEQIQRNMGIEQNTRPAGAQEGAETE